MVKSTMGILPKKFMEREEKSVKTITFSVTEECNLRCKYCYMYDKNSFNVMTFETAKEAIDAILTDDEYCDTDAVVWEFIGGEPTLEMELIDKISDYAKYKMFTENHKWFDIYCFNMSTNGITYHTDAVQNYIVKNKHHISMGMSVDGNKEKHDLQRVKLDGSGSYDDVVKNVPLWRKQFPISTSKATFASDDLIFLKDSIIHLWDIGIDNVAANIVFENVWKKGDDLIFEEQLKALADHIIDNKLWDRYSVRFFSASIGEPYTDADLDRNYCGAGKMLAIDTEGNFFPCVRFLDFTLDKNESSRNIGNIKSGFNHDKMRPFAELKLKNFIDEECLTCEVASGCAWCSGFCCDDTGTIFSRTKYNCLMHKANVRANEYYWDKYYKKTNEVNLESEYKEEPNTGLRDQYLFILSNNAGSHCYYDHNNNDNNSIDMEFLKSGTSFARENGFVPVIVGENLLDDVNIINISRFDNLNDKYNQIIIVDEGNYSEVFDSDIILSISKESISNLTNILTTLTRNNNSISLVLKNVMSLTENDLTDYKSQLLEMVPQLRSLEVTDTDTNASIDIFDMALRTDSDGVGCGAGDSIFTLAPDNKLYICPAFYSLDIDYSIGDITNGLDIEKLDNLRLNDKPICFDCSNQSCKRCHYLSLTETNEIRIAPQRLCDKADIEHQVGILYQSELIKSELEKGLL